MNRLEKITTILNSAKHVKSRKPAAHPIIQQKNQSGLNVNISNNKNSSVSVVLKKHLFLLVYFVFFYSVFGWLPFNAHHLL